MNSIVIDNISIEKLHSIEREREKTLIDKNFIQWCKDMRIGSRVEVKDWRAIELQQQYEHNYPNWIKKMF
jgi:hypothetical protein